VEERDFFRFAGVSSARLRGPRLPFASLRCALLSGLGLVAFLPGFFFVLMTTGGSRRTKIRQTVGRIARAKFPMVVAANLMLTRRDHKLVSIKIAATKLRWWRRTIRPTERNCL
jgi:hypothetical protein